MRRVRCAAATGLLAAATAAAGLKAQRPADRLSLERLRDSLAAASDTAALEASARRSVAASGAEVQALGQLYRGFVDLRL